MNELQLGSVRLNDAHGLVRFKDSEVLVATDHPPQVLNVQVHHCGDVCTKMQDADSDAKRSK